MVRIIVNYFNAESRVSVSLNVVAAHVETILSSHLFVSFVCLLIIVV